MKTEHPKFCAVAVTSDGHQVLVRKDVDEDGKGMRVETFYNDKLASLMMSPLPHELVQACVDTFGPNEADAMRAKLLEFSAQVEVDETDTEGPMQ